MKESFQCDLCSKEFSSLIKLNFHSKRQHEARGHKNKNWTCNICGFEGSHTNLMRHMRTHTGERPFMCEVSGCGMAFAVKSALKNHIKCKHSDARPFKCDFPGCSYTFKTSTNLYRHKMTHSDERPFACPNSGCSYRAKWKYYVERHVESVHQGTKRFTCSQCDYRTAGSGNLKSHLLRHSTKRDFMCSHPQCAESFKCSSDLKRHFSSRHGEMNFVCAHPGCGAKFSSTKNLYDHKRWVHAKKNHACPNPQCNYRTNKLTDLVRHKLTHERSHAKIPCSVEGCEYKGKNSFALKEHMNRHKILLPCPVSGCGKHAATEEALKKHAKLHSPLGRAFQCPLCFKHYQTLRQLQIHCPVHTNEKPIQCGHCQFATYQQGVVKAHISTVHAAIQFPSVVHLLDDRECLRCKVILPSAEFLDHCKGHISSVVNT